MSDAQILTENFKNKTVVPKSGVFRFWGNSFVRPADNVHSVTELTYDEKDRLLVFSFNEGEKLSVWTPRKMKIDGENFLIQDAKKVRWEWYEYGKPQEAGNLRYQVYEKKSGALQTETNFDLGRMKCSLLMPAVEMI